MKKISIIIIVKNDPRLKILLDKLAAIKTSMQFETIVVDASDAGYHKYNDKYKNVKWLEYKNETQKKYTYAEQRNIGIKNATGDIIVFIDADCSPAENWLDELVKPIIEKRELVCAGNVKSVRPYPTRWDGYYLRFENKRYINMIVGANVAIDKSVFETIGYFDENIKIGGNEDYDISLRIKNAGIKIGYNKNAIVYHDWGDVRENINRVLNYGERRFHSYVTNIRYIKDFDMIIIIYAIYIIFLPLSYYFPYYPLIILIPLIKNFYTYKNLLKALDNVFYSIVESVGFIKGAVTYKFATARSVKNI